MKGNVIGFDPDTNTGAISGHDGKRYEFATADWHSHDKKPAHGDLVDFAPEGERATQIYLLEPEYVAASFGQFLFSLNGRISRSQFWLKWFLPVIAVYVGLGLVMGAAFGGGSFRAAGAVFVLMLILDLVLLWPNIAVMVKRIHDRNKSGWIVLAFYVPLFLSIVARMSIGIGHPVAVFFNLIVLAVGIWFLIDFGFMRGTIGENRYGPDPVAHR